jgi:NADH-quinone oxidoreductase subunit J
VALTLRHRKDTKTQNIAAQLRTRREDRVRIVSMPTASAGDADATASAANKN